MSKAPLYYKKGDAPPSPYRIGWTPTGEHTRWVECPRGTRTVPAALRFARPYGSNCGISGRIEVQEMDGPVWRTIRTAPVKNSEAGPWAVPSRIPIHREPFKMEVWGTERCCFCRTPTPMWTSLADRNPGQQVACCERCAGERIPEEVPTKEQWFKAEQALTKKEQSC